MTNWFITKLGSLIETFSFRWNAFLGMFNTPRYKQGDLIYSTTQLQQLNLMLAYQQLLRDKHPLPTFDQVEFRCFSQNGEDGILHFIFSLIGTTNKRCVEACAGDGIECNTANLVVNHGWLGLMFDGNERNVKRGNYFYKTMRSTSVWSPRFVKAWITAENINTLIESNGFSGEIDLLSLDMDGVDWWVWKALTVVQPRVVVLEYKHIWGPDASVTVPYSPDFYAGKDGKSVYYNGASLAAFVKLARERNYRLIGVERLGFNAFFLRNDIGMDIFPEVSPQACFDHPMNQWMIEKNLPLVRDYTWEQV